MKFSLTILIALLFLSSVSHETEGKSENETFVDEEELELELEMQLKILNKPPIKSFKRNGGIIDCIDIYKQPAFDHPDLKNHKLQMRPSSLPEGMESGRKDASIRQSDQNEFSGCPSGTVPLKRVTKEDLIRAKAVLKLVRPNNDFVRPDDYIPGGQLDYAALTTARKEFYGAKARVSVFNLTGVSAPQISETMLWIGSNTDADYNSIEFGWTVNPQLYGGDTRTHSYSLWTVDGFKETGCYNALCPGYVHVSPTFIMGDVLSVVTIPGKQVAGIWFTLFLDPKTSNWWLVVTRADGENEGVGYWPKELLPSMAESARVIQLGGKAYSAGAGIYLPLGSGVYLESDFSRTCLIDHIEFVNKNHQYYKPTGESMIWDTSDLEHYKIKYLGELQPRGCSLVFGGPDIRT